MAAKPAPTSKISTMRDPVAPPTPRTQSEPPMTNPIFTRLSGKRKNRAGKLAGFIIVAVIVAAIGLIGLYFATGPHDSSPAKLPPAAHAA